jgi:hypothetical protein
LAVAVVDVGMVVVVVLLEAMEALAVEVVQIMQLVAQAHQDKEITEELHRQLHLVVVAVLVP